KKSMESNLSYHEYDSILIVAQLKDSEQLVGGFNPTSFKECNPYKDTQNSFVFYYTNKDDSKTARVSYVEQKEYAIYYNEEEPGFGRGPDLLCKNSGVWTSNPESYPSIGIPKRFEIQSYEIFTVYV
ncbi:16538_t:CDS:1, partial [Funneliformis caledonium]